MVELYIVRHGETDTNTGHLLNGKLTNMPLNEVGIKQAEALAKEINIEDFDEIYASPMDRAMKTAEILNHGVLKIQPDERLYEADYGSWDGLKEADLMAKYPDAFDENGFVLPEYTKYVSDGEDYEHVYQRVNDFINDMSKKKNDSKILVVCHGFISRSFLKVVTGVTNISSVVQLNNAGVAKYRISPKGNRFLIFYGRQKDID